VVKPETVREIIERLPGVQLVELANAAHDLHLDRPDEWREALIAFLDSLDGQRAWRGSINCVV
jgi:pimeloyl-ACP methyl ester carboxylesterase